MTAKQSWSAVHSFERTLRGALQGRGAYRPAPKHRLSGSFKADQQRYNLLDPALQLFETQVSIQPCDHLQSSVLRRIVSLCILEMTMLQSLLSSLGVANSANLVAINFQQNNCNEPARAGCCMACNH